VQIQDNYQSPSIRPICINHGCEKPVTVSRGRLTGTGIHSPRWRIHCGHCQAASWGKHPHREGVTPYKTGMCTNIDEHLGFVCFTNWDKVPDGYKGRTQVDHKDGDPSNNNPDNLDELCSHCHNYKGQLSGDFNGWRRRQ